MNPNRFEKQDALVSICIQRMVINNYIIYYLQKSFSSEVKMIKKRNKKEAERHQSKTWCVNIADKKFAKSIYIKIYKERKAKKYILYKKHSAVRSKIKVFNDLKEEKTNLQNKNIKKITWQILAKH